MLRLKIFILCLFSIFLIGQTAQPASADGSNIKITVQSGFGGKVKSGKGFPVKVTVENNGPDFAGDLLFNFSASYNVSGAKVLAIDVPKGTKKTYSLSLPAYSEEYYNGPQIKQSIFLYKGSWKDNHEQSFLGDKVLKPKYIDPAGEVLGLLSEDPDRLKELKVLPGGSYEPIVLTEEMMPEDELGLDSLDYLLIDEFPLAKLKKTQQNAIIKWVQNGGILIAGGAPNQAASYGNVYSVLPMKADHEVLADTNFFTVKEKKLSAAKVPFFIGQVDKQAEIPIKSGDLPAVVHKGYGAGEIWQTAFSLGDDLLSSWNDYGQWFVSTSMLSHASNSSYLQGAGPNPFDLIYNEFAEVNEYFSASNFTVGQIGLMLLIYLLLIVPFLYVLLKRMDKREHAWWIILSIAFISSAGIFAIGAKDRLAKPQLNQMGIYKVENDQLTGYEAVAFLSNTGGNYELDFSDGDFYGVPAVSMMAAYDGKRLAVLENNRKSSTVTFPNVEYWSSRTYFGHAAKQDAGRFEIQLNYQNKHLVGQIVNHFPFDFEELYIWSGTTKIKLGPLKSGASLTVNQSLHQDYLTRPYSSGNGYSMPNSKKALDQLKRQRMEFNAIEYLYSNSAVTNQPILVGYTKNSVINANIKGKNEIRRPLSLIYQALELEPNFSGSFNIKNDLMQHDFKTIHGAVFNEWQRSRINNEIDIDNGEYDYVSVLPKNLLDKKPLFKELEITWYGRNVSYSLLNHKTGKFEDLSNTHTSVKEHLDQIISPEGTIVVKLNKSGQNDPRVKLPSLTVKGEINP